MFRSICVQRDFVYILRDNLFGDVYENVYIESGEKNARILAKANKFCEILC